MAFKLNKGAGWNPAATDSAKKGLKIIQALKPDVSVKFMIHRALAGWEKARPHGTIHASELLKDKEFCPREWAFLDLGFGKKKDDYVGTAMRITFDHGRDMEWRMRNDWLRSYAVGAWECGICKTDAGIFGKEPKFKCPTCGWGHKWEYKETRLLDPVSGVSGGVDLFIDVGLPKVRLVEIKSIDKDMHKALVAPMMEHKFRTSLYLKLAELSHLPESERIGTKQATLLYVSKSYGFKDESLKEAGIPDAPFSPFKEFPIERDDGIVQTPLNKATSLTVWRHLPQEEKAKNMPCGVCHNGLIKRAQICPVVGPCFSGTFPATITWLEQGKPKHEGKTTIAGD